MKTETLYIKDFFGLKGIEADFVVSNISGNQSLHFEITAGQYDRRVGLRDSRKHGIEFMVAATTEPRSDMAFVFIGYVSAINNQGNGFYEVKLNVVLDAGETMALWEGK